jgi:hypothetical protein
VCAGTGVREFAHVAEVLLEASVRALTERWKGGLDQLATPPTGVEKVARRRSKEEQGARAVPLRKGLPFSPLPVPHPRDI